MIVFYSGSKSMGRSGLAVHWNFRKAIFGDLDTLTGSPNTPYVELSKRHSTYFRGSPGIQPVMFATSGLPAA